MATIKRTSIFFTDRQISNMKIKAIQMKCETMSHLIRVATEYFIDHYQDIKREDPELLQEYIEENKFRS